MEAESEDKREVVIVSIEEVINHKLDLLVNEVIQLREIIDKKNK
jgi:hypothetical protein